VQDPNRGLRKLVISLDDALMLVEQELCRPDTVAIPHPISIILNPEVRKS